MMLSDGVSLRQSGMVLLISLVFLLLLSLLGLSSMQGALAQQKITGSVWQRNQSFQHAESAARLGELAVQRAAGGLPQCHSVVTCAPPGEAFSLKVAGKNPVSAVTWVAVRGGLHGIQVLGRGSGMAHLPPRTSARVYRVTAVGLSGLSRTVVETVYAQVEDESGSRFRRVSWRQLQ